jgi:alpha-1,6-mannosyltransferase
VKTPKVGDITPTRDERGIDRSAWLALLVWASGLTVALTLDDPRLRFLPFLGAMGLSTLGWWGLSGRACRGALSPALLGTAVVAGVLFRLSALLAPPAFSEDVFRYVFEGRVVWSEGPAFPFSTAPAEAARLGVSPTLLDAAWRRINHAELSTIYPPFAQLVFALAGGLGELGVGPHLLLLKLALTLADLGVWLLLARALPRLGAPRSAALVWGLSPLVVLEIAREGHGDSLAALGLALMVSGFAARRPRVGYLGLVLAALAKLNGLVAIPAALRNERRGASILAGLVLLGLPWLIAGPTASAGLLAYAERWRAGDGAFGLAHGAAQLLLGGSWGRLGAWTVTADQLARALTAAIFAAVAFALLRRRVAPERVPERAGACLFFLLLLAPTLHPWYATWVLPFAALPGFALARPIALLVTLAPLLHHPAWLELVTGRWTDVGWVRAAVHVPVWLSVGLALSRQRSHEGRAPGAEAK